MATLGYTSVTSNTLLSFGSNVLYRNDDGSSTAIDITSIFQDGIVIGDQTFTTLYVNNNGNITFGSGLSTFTPGVIGGTTGLNIVAPYWADVDTRTDVANVNDGVFWDFKSARDSVVITWNKVGYYSGGIDKLDTFQLELRDRGAGNVEMIFRYDDINWTTGNASGGSGGLGGTVARAGFTLGGTYFELPTSGNQTSMLNLDNSVGNLGVTGVWQFILRDGEPTGFGTTGNDRFIGTAGRDIWFGLGGHDIAYGRAGNDAIYGNAGNDSIAGEAGYDRLYGDSGYDKLYGGSENDLLNGGSGNDTLNGGTGYDRVEYQSSSSQEIVVRLDTGRATGHGTDVLVSIEHATTGYGADLLIGNGYGNTLISGGGADRLYGNGGNDRLSGGTGNDSLNGGSGSDRFIFNTGGGTDKVYGFQNGYDKFEIQSGATSYAQLSVTDAGTDVRIAFGSTVILVQDVAHTLINSSDFIFT